MHTSNLSTRCYARLVIVIALSALMMISVTLVGTMTVLTSWLVQTFVYSFAGGMICEGLLSLLDGHACGSARDMDLDHDAEQTRNNAHLLSAALEVHPS